MLSVGRLGVILVGLLAVACGGGALNLKPGAMPEDGDFTGVWYSTQYGEMHFVQNGAAVQGRYGKDERKGTIAGEADGDLMTFEWVEMKAMVANNPQETRGHGYFRYVVADNGEHRIEGRWGLGDDHTSGGTWEAYRMKNRSPEVGGGGGDSGGGFDGDEEDDDFGGDDEEEDEDFL